MEPSRTTAATLASHRPSGMVAWWPLDEPNGSTVINDIEVTIVKAYPGREVNWGFRMAPMQ